MTFTLITITLNGAATIEDCINSILCQTRLPDEYLFVDGGSQDGTQELIREGMAKLQAKGVKTSLFMQQHEAGKAGIPEAWNQGIAQATGDIIALLNCDDCFMPDTIQRVCLAFEAHPETELLSSPINMVDSQNKILYSLYPKCLFCCEFLMPLPHPGTFFTSSLYRKIGLYNTDYRISADYDMIWRCRKAKVKLHYLPNATVNMRAGGLANSSRAKARKETLAIALHHSNFPLFPWLAYLLRKLIGK